VRYSFHRVPSLRSGFQKKANAHPRHRYIGPIRRHHAGRSVRWIVPRVGTSQETRYNRRDSIQLSKRLPRMKTLLKRVLCAAALLIPLCFSCPLYGQEYSVRAIDAASGKPLKGIPITLRHACNTTGSGTNTKMHCKFIQRKTGSDGIAHFPEAGSLGDIDDIFSTPIEYGAVCCDISNPVIPGMGTITFARRSLKEMLHWIFIGD
jgi:hypothetical protein